MKYFKMAFYLCTGVYIAKFIYGFVDRLLGSAMVCGFRKLYSRLDHSKYRESPVVIEFGKSIGIYKPRVSAKMKIQGFYKD